MNFGVKQLKGKFVFCEFEMWTLDFVSAALPVTKWLGLHPPTKSEDALISTCHGVKARQSCYVLCQPRLVIEYNWINQEDGQL